MKMRLTIIPVIVLMAIFLTMPEISEGQRRGRSGRGRSPMQSDTLPVPREGQEKKIVDVLEDIAANQK